MENYKSLYETYTDEDKELISFLPSVVGIYELEPKEDVEEEKETQETGKYINPLAKDYNKYKYVFHKIFLKDTFLILILHQYPFRIFRADKFYREFVGVLIMKNMLKDMEQTNWVDCKVGFRTSSRESYAKNPKKYDDLGKYINLVKN